MKPAEPSESASPQIPQSPRRFDWLTRPATFTALGGHRVANMVVWIAGAKWKIRHCKVPATIHGDCNYERRTIRISDKLAGEDRLNTLIHEVVHARFPDLAEDPVSEFADTLAAIVHHAGFRSEEEEENG